MINRTNARLAGYTFLCHLAASITRVVLTGRATSAEGIAAKLANIAAHARARRIGVWLALFTCFSAFVWGVTPFLERDDRAAVAGNVGV
ncbi:hypothetical protein HUU39_15345 [candidate division KSB1 bacterium]|nr:hypothetical protein [bacterium]NUM66616.1 hypothetical protein [candidate division KSB1 bacterium]